MNAVVGESGAAVEAEGGPMWGRFFDSIGNDDNESVMSGSHVPTDLPSSMRNLSHVPQSPQSEVHPNDSASVMDDEPASASEALPRKGAPSVAGPLPVDDGTYVFKFKTPSGRTHRFQSRHDDVEHLREIVMGKLATDPFFTDFKSIEGSDVRPDPIDFHLSYTDADGDTVLITSDHDVTDSVKIARNAGTDRVVLLVQGGKGWAEATAAKAKAAEAPVSTPPVVKEVDEMAEFFSRPSVPPASQPPPPLTPSGFPGNTESPPKRDEDIMGIPKDLLLPASIGVLAVVILGVFTVSRLTASSRY